MERYIKNIKIKKNKKELEYDYEVDDETKKYLHLDNKLKIEYSMDVSKVPDEIAVIPFITGILPMIYLENINVYVDKIDKDFYEAFFKIKKGYKKMLPKGDWKGKLIAKKIINHTSNPKKGKSSLFFSGGVDSTCTLVSHVEEKPEFILIWGSDILQTNEKSWDTAKKIAQTTADMFSINTNFISSNFRFYLNENALTTKYRDLLPSSWWYDVQHGAALLGHVAPIAYTKKIDVHYIPATYCESNKNVVCASYPTLDEKMKFCGCHVIHDGFKYGRLEKVKKIVDFSRKEDKPLTLRVCCTEREEEINCCMCEKCYRTICEIIACKDDPNNYGFPVSTKDIKKMKKRLLKFEIEGNSIRYYKEVQNQMLLDKEYFKKMRYVRWLLKFDFDKLKKKDFKKEIWDEYGNKIILK